MMLLMRKIPRACVAFTLILALLGLGAIDATVCRGADGHQEIETRLNSSCHTATAVSAPADGAELLHLAAAQPADEGESCQDTPLIERALTAHGYLLPVACLVQFVTISYPTVTGLAASAPHATADPGSLLSRLRSTTLLI